MIRLLSTLFLAIAVGLAACSSDNGGGCKDIGGSIVYGEDGIPEVQGEVTTTASCLQIIEVEIGEGDAAQAGERVSIHYTGYLADGTIFGTSRERGEPIAFSLDRVNQGWQEGIPGMQVGGMRRLIVPAKLASGTFAFGPSVPPNATLIFDVQLLELIR